MILGCGGKVDDWDPPRDDASTVEVIRENEREGG